MVLMKRNGNSTIFLITTVVGLNIEQINRGGLHEISDNFFILINKMELVDVLRVYFSIYYSGEDIRKELYDRIHEYIRDRLSFM